jgi:hypothetical protein
MRGIHHVLISAQHGRGSNEGDTCSSLTQTTTPSRRQSAPPRDGVVSWSRHHARGHIWAMLAVQNGEDAGVRSLRQPDSWAVPPASGWPVHPELLPLLPPPRHQQLLKSAESYPPCLPKLAPSASCTTAVPPAAPAGALRVRAGQAVCCISGAKRGQDCAGRETSVRATQRMLLGPASSLHEQPPRPLSVVVLLTGGPRVG